MTPSEQRRYDTLLEIARKAEHAANITFRFNMRALPRQAIGGLTLERSEVIVQQWHVAMQELRESLDGVSLDEMEVYREGDQPFPNRRTLMQPGQRRINLAYRR